MSHVSLADHSQHSTAPTSCWQWQRDAKARSPTHVYFRPVASSTLETDCSCVWFGGGREAGFIDDEGAGPGFPLLCVFSAPEYCGIGAE